MNEIYIENGPKKYRDLTERVIAFCLKKMLPRHRTINIWVEFEKMSDWGNCHEGEDDHDIYISLNRKMLRSKKTDDLIDTICHEMIHCKQIVRRELIDQFDPYRHKWLCRDGKYRAYDGLPYESKPWEVEAYRDSWKLAKEFIENDRV